MQAVIFARSTLFSTCGSGFFPIQDRQAINTESSAKVRFLQVGGTRSTPMFCSAVLGSRLKKGPSKRLSGEGHRSTHQIYQNTHTISTNHFVHRPAKHVILANESAGKFEEAEFRQGVAPHCRLCCYSGKRKVAVSVGLSALVAPTTFTAMVLTWTPRIMRWVSIIIGNRRCCSFSVAFPSRSYTLIFLELIFPLYSIN